ncbi:MAG: GspH/FimT family pseudopilin [Burkholderiaceae bacterium]|nr:GspH/FimT family pseudopilin [Burkholderiaceae bacterium]
MGSNPTASANPTQPGCAGSGRLVPCCLGRRAGYTVVELMVTVALIAIVTTVALPYFSLWVDRWRVDHVIIQLQNVMRFANAQAARTRCRVVIQAKPATCRSLQNARNWSCGLTVFQDVNQSSTQDADELTLQDIQEFHALTVIHASFGSDARLIYGSHGAPVASSGRFEVYPAAQPDSPAARTICLSSGGRMRVKAGAGPC